MFILNPVFNKLFKQNANSFANSEFEWLWNLHMQHHRIVSGVGFDTISLLALSMF